MFNYVPFWYKQVFAMNENFKQEPAFDYDANISLEDIFLKQEHYPYVKHELDTNTDSGIGWEHQPQQPCPTFTPQANMTMLEPNYKCSICPSLCEHANTFTHHVSQLNQSSVTKFKCKECAFETKNRSGLAYHCQKHRSEGSLHTFKCSHCDYTAKHRSGLAYHLSKHKSPETLELFRCPECTFVSKSRSGLFYHSLKHKKPEEVKWYYCTECPYKVNFKSSWKVHMLKHRKPNEIVLYNCEECSYKTKHKPSLKKHMNLHKDWISCSFCKFKTKTLLEFQDHIVKNHEVVNNGQV